MDIGSQRIVFNAFRSDEERIMVEESDWQKIDSEVN
jgi:hypothetical protein